MKKSITQQELHRLLRYNPDTGHFHWIKKHGRLRAGSLAGTLNGTCNCWQIQVNGRLYLAHRLAWLYVNGEFPEHQIDHIDGDRLNNRFANIRPCTNAENAQNKVAYSTNKAGGLIGVGAGKNGSWTAQIHVRGKKHHLGVFSNPLDAHSAYLNAKQELHAFNPRAREAKVQL